MAGKEGVVEGRKVVLIEHELCVGVGVCGTWRCVGRQGCGCEGGDVRVWRGGGVY